MKISKWDGQQISVPGIYEGVDIDVYHSGRLCVGPSMSSSGLRTIFMESEAHYWDKSPLNPNRAPKKESEAFSLGRAVHHSLLGEAYFSKLFVIRPEKLYDAKAKEELDWNGNRLSCKKWLQEQAAAKLTVLTSEHVERIKGMALSLGRHELVKAGVLNGKIECTMAWVDKETGVWMLARPDVIPTDSGDFVDLKTTTDVSYVAIQRTLADYGYHQQGALVGEGYEILTGQKMASFSLFFIESSRPYCARFMQLKDHDLALGRQQNRNAVRRFAAAMNSGEWPGPGGRQDTVQHVEINDRMRDVFETRLKFEGTD